MDEGLGQSAGWAWRDRRAAASVGCGLDLAGPMGSCGSWGPLGSERGAEAEGTVEENILLANNERTQQCNKQARKHPMCEKAAAYIATEGAGKDHKITGAEHILEGKNEQTKRIHTKIEQKLQRNVKE